MSTLYKTKVQTQALTTMLLKAHKNVLCTNHKFLLHALCHVVTSSQIAIEIFIWNDAVDQLNSMFN